MHNLEELKIWQKSIELVKLVYAISKKYPDEERYGLQSQSRRSAVSMASNIAEGAGRDSYKEFLHFLTITVGSSYELITQLRIAFELNYIGKDNFDEVKNDIEEIQKMIRAFKENLKSKI